MLGPTLSHYRILERLGKGGMGEVYLAEDESLKRQVALKVLPPELAAQQDRLMRFRREAESLAALDHPNIVTIYSVEECDGVHFFTMGVVKGQTLDKLIPPGGMGLDEIFSIAIPLTDALAAAHEKGITHRDLKPGNVMVDEEGRVKVLDFGLATPQAGEAIVGDEATTQAGKDRLTVEGTVVGTGPYMSPEQIEGRPVDHRSDIFSLGVVLYQMATGSRPFEGDSWASLAAAILRVVPSQVDELRADLPHHLGRILRHCLEKDPEKRFQAAKDARNDLVDLKEELERSEIVAYSAARGKTGGRRIRRRYLVAMAAAIMGALAYGVGDWLASDREPPVAVEAAKPRLQKIVVLPFENLGAEEDEYFADGISEEIMIRLSAVDGLGVISRTSAMQYKTNRPALAKIRTELGVDYVLDGTIRWDRANQAKGPGRVRITPQLIRAEDDTQIWSQRYDRVLSDLFAVQADIADRVIRELEIKIGEAAQFALGSPPTESMEAYQAFLRGLELKRYPSFSVEHLERAAEMFGRAVKLDPEFALAYAELSRVWSLLYFNSGDDPTYRREATAAIEKALALAPQLPAVRLAAGYFQYRVEMDFDRALEEFEVARAGLPGNVDLLRGTAYIYRRQGRWDDAVDLLELAFELDPRNATVAYDVFHSYYSMRQYDLAASFVDRAIALAPDQVAFWQSRALNELARKGTVAAARAALEQAPAADEAHFQPVRAWLELYDRRYEEALAEATTPHAALAYWEKSLLDRIALLAHERLGQPELARVRAETMVARIREELERWPDDAFLHAELGLAYAHLGRREEALEMARGAADTAHEAYTGPRFLENLARVHSILGDRDAALDLLEQVMSVPHQYALSVAQLELDPVWDPLRDSSRFSLLLRGNRI